MALKTLILNNRTYGKLPDIQDRELPKKVKQKIRRPFSKVILTPEIKKITLLRCRCYYEFKEIEYAKWEISFYEENVGEDNLLKHYIIEGMREMEINYRKCAKVKGYLDEYLLPAPLYFYDRCYGNNIKKYDVRGNLLKIGNR